MNVPDATPPYPLETVADRRFVLRAQVVACAVAAPALVAAGLLGGSPRLFAFGAAALFGAAQAGLALRGAPRPWLVATRAALLALFATGVFLR